MSTSHPASLRKKREIYTSANQLQFTSIHNLLENDDNEIVYPENLAYSALDKLQDPDSLLRDSNNNAFDFIDDLNPDIFDHNDFYTTANGFPDSNPASSVSTSTSSSPACDTSVPSRQHLPSLSHQSSFSQSKNKSTSSSQSSIATPDKRPSDALSNYQFGREITTGDSIPLSQSFLPTQTEQSSPPTYMPDFNPNDWNDTSNLKYSLKIHDVLSKSRVETQIKVLMNFYPPPSESVIHLPADTISKPKLQLRNRFTPIPSALSLDTIVVCESDHSRHVSICQGCMKRERKRAFRKKERSPIEEAHWNLDSEKRAIVFNCREVIDFGPLVPINVDGQIVSSQQVELPMRMACYCRHHGEKVGFRALFVVRDFTGKVVARGSTKSIMITDDHKAANLKATVGVKRTNSEAEETLPAVTPDAGPSRKRKINSSPRSSAVFSKVSVSPATPNFDFNIQSPLSPQTNGYHRTSSLDNLNSLISRPVSAIPSPKESPSNVVSPRKQSVDDWAGQENLPTIQRIIPASGSIRGGIEVTLLGCGFVEGLVTKFGENNSISTSCWSSNTIVTHLPPSRIAGPVVVTFEGFVMPDPQVFSYYDDTDRQLIELALQVVGIKMNGRLEGAKDIALRIVGGSTGLDAANVHLLQNTAGTTTNRATNLALDELEGLLLKCLDLVDCYVSEYSPNWQLSNAEGQTMLHLAACLGLNRFTTALIERGSRLDIQDKSGFTALHFAGLHRHQALVDTLLSHGSNPHQRTYTGLTYTQLRESECITTPISQRFFEFNGGLDSESESEWDSDSTEEIPDTILEEEEEEEDVHPRGRSFKSFLTSWRDSSVFRRTSPSPEGNGEDMNSNFWELIYPNTGELSRSDSITSGSTVVAPPSYDEIFPVGSSSNEDYSRAALDEEKPSAEVATLDIPTEVVATEEPSEEEVLAAWKSKRMKIQNDRMFLYFWLPVFISILIWVSMKVAFMFDTIDASWAASYVKEKIVAGVKGGLTGAKNKLIEPVLKNTRRLVNRNQGIPIEVD